MGGALVSGWGSAAIAAVQPRWSPRRAFRATTPPLTEGTGAPEAERAPRRVHPCAPPDAALMHTGVDAR